MQCQTCAKDATLKCSSCKKIYYCNKDCQKADWKSHKTACKELNAEKKVDIKSTQSLVNLIEVQPGEGSGLSNTMINRKFPSVENAEHFVKNSFSGRTPRKLVSEFATKLGWDLTIYAFNSSDTRPGGVLNSAGIFLTCKWSDGLSPHQRLSGTIYVTGRSRSTSSTGRILTSYRLWGMLNFIYDAMDLFGEYAPPHPTLLDWAKRYKQARWAPFGGDGGINVYEDDVDSCKLDSVIS